MYVKFFINNIENNCIIILSVFCSISYNGMWLAEVGEFEVGCSCLVGCLKKAEMLKLALLPQFWQTTVVRRLVYFIL
jgi:hypothetical protein